MVNTDDFNWCVGVYKEFHNTVLERQRVQRELDDEIASECGNSTPWYVYSFPIWLCQLHALGRLGPTMYYLLLKIKLHSLLRKRKQFIPHSISSNRIYYVCSCWTRLSLYFYVMFMCGFPSFICLQDSELINKNGFNKIYLFEYIVFNVG